MSGLDHDDRKNSRNAAVGTMPTIATLPPLALTQSSSSSSPVIRGGWSTSICDFFHHANRHSDCCALACCGILLSDRNAHLLSLHSSSSSSTATPFSTPVNWKRRLCMNLVVPIVTVLVLLISRAHDLASLRENTDDPDARAGEEALWNLIILITIIILFVVLTTRAKNARIPIRNAILAKIHQTRTSTTGEEEDGGGHDAILGSAVPPTSQSMVTARVPPNVCVRMHLGDTHAAHGVCGCYRKDVLRDPSSDNRTIDFCSKLFAMIRSCCCGICCDSYCQCCGMCAIGQEDRELQNLLPKQFFQMDYITFEPYTNYYGRIQSLRREYNHGMYAHIFWATSQLTKLLGKVLVVVIFLLTALSLVLWGLVDYGIANIIMILATFFQSFLILYFVHWWNHKLDLSFDAVVKYFAAGFCLSSFMAILYELIVSTVVGLVVYSVVVLGITSEIDTTTNPSPHDIARLARHYEQDHIGLFTIYVFVNAFVVAALVEELVKYFGYYMVETPDLLPPNELVENNNNNNNNTTPADGVDGLRLSSSNEQQHQEDDDGVLGSVSLQDPPRTMVSRGAAITVAMVAVATGFACSENFLYVLLYTPSSNFDAALGTLIARSLFPVHPLCAALQSIGVVQRDLLSMKIGLGRILLPAILLHGSYDFVLMLMAFLEKVNEPIRDDDIVPTAAPTAAPTTNSLEVELELEKKDILSLSIAIGIIFLSIVYYVVAASLQRHRLKSMSGQQQQTSSIHPQGDNDVVAAAPLV